MKHVKSSEHEFHLMSGTKHDFGEMAKQSKDGILHSPAHISATHHQKIAKHFSYIANSHKNLLHAVQIHVKPHDKILHVSRLPHSMKAEHETIIPAGTKLKYSHSTHEKHDLNNTPIKVDHFEIHSQE